jgi:hypothetical protein
MDRRLESKGRDPHYTSNGHIVNYYEAKVHFPKTCNLKLEAIRLKL